MSAAAQLRSEERPVAAIVPAADLARDGDAWDALLARASQPNPHYGRQVVEAHRASGLAPADLQVVVVRHSGRLMAALPFVVPSPLLGRRIAASPFVSAYVTGTAPLVADEAAPEVLDALVEGLATASAGRPWRWPLLVDGAAATRLRAAMAAAGWQVGIVEAFSRPVFLRRPDLETALALRPLSTRARDLRRRSRRLAERGAVVVETASEGEALRGALEAFLALESLGWKGRRGTALARRPATDAFARTLFSGAPGPVRPRIDVLRLDGRPLAASLALVAGDTATLFKSAYAETERAAAPGVLLEWDLVRSLHEDRFAERLDSAALPGSVLDGLYPDRVTVADLVAVPSRADRDDRPLDSLLAKARLRQTIRRQLKIWSAQVGLR